MPSLFSRRSWSRSKRKAVTESPNVDRNRGALLDELYSPPNCFPDADVVFVHGLNPINQLDYARTAWTAPNGVFWPQDLLPQDIPKARILLFGYNSNVAINVSGATVRDHANSLLDRLHRKRVETGAADRPLIFVAHSLGGLVIKQALVTAKLNERYSVLRESTRALVFFGTPHRGGNNVSLGKVAANIVVSVSGAANNNIMDYLAKNSLLSQQANEDFGYQVHNYRVVTFFERLPTKLKGVGSLGNHIRAMVVNEESAKLGCTDEILIAVDSDHTNLNKFWGRDHFYEAAGGKLRDLMRYCLESRAEAQSVPVLVKDPLHLMIPYANNSAFTGREDILARVEDGLSSQVSHQRVALWGLGGVGKTQIALHVAYSRQNKASVFWVHADNYARFSQDYREIAKLAQLPEKPNETEQELLFRVRRWLESPMSGPWLLIVDNADNLTEFFPPQVPDADGKKQIGLALYLPQGTKGCILLTTRDRVIASRLANQDIVEVKAMSPDEAEALLLRYAPDSIPTTAAKAALPRLLEEVKFLPLAIVAAAAFMRENDVSTLEYLELYTQSKQAQSELMGSEFYDFRRGAEVPEAVLTTYFMPFQRLQRQSPLATDFLRLIAFFDRNGIPKELLLESKLPGTESPVQFTKAVGSLLSLGLMTKSADGSMYHVHQLVHLSIEAFFPDEDGTWRARAMEILLKLFHLFPNQENELDKWNWEACATYSPHVQAALEKMSPETPSPTERMLLVRLATYLEAAGRSGDAEAHLRRCTASSDAIEGEDLMDLKILEGYIMLGKTLESQAKWEHAEELYTLIVAQSEKNVGLDNPIVIATVRLLIRLLIRRGNLSRAEELTRSLVERYKRVLGDDHPDVVLIVHRLAKILRKQEKYEEAESLYQWAVIRTDVRLGPMHPYTLMSITRLALVLQCRGQYQISEEVLQRALTRYEQFQDPVDDLALQSFVKLARVLEQQRNLDQAEKILRRATSGYEKSRGRMDPHTLSCIRKLGSLLCKRGDFKQAEEIQRQVLERWEELVGTEHPYTLSGLFDLARTLQEQGKYTESESCFRRALEGYEKVFPERPAIFKCLGSFGILCALQGNLDEGVALCQRATDGVDKLLGAEHTEAQSFKKLLGFLLCVARDRPAHLTEPIAVYGQLMNTSSPPSQPLVENWTVTECGTVLYMESLD